MFPRAVAFSLAGHLAVFGMFSLSFGSRLADRSVTQGFFWGDILPAFHPEIPATSFSKDPAPIIARQSIVSFLKEPSRQGTFDQPVPYLKPLSAAVSEYRKITYAPKSGPWQPPSGKGVSPIMFYPRLPDNFLFYFQDRQSVHIELAYRIGSRARAGSIELRRKVSSGNLEADLLTMRYISHYLFIQEGGLAKDSWKTVKIDLSAKAESK